MKQINNGFCSCYYLTEEGKIYNADTKEYKEANKEHYFLLKTEKNTTKKVYLRQLYKLVYNKHYVIDNIVNLENEVWKEIEGTDSLYYISNLGRVKSYANYEAKILKPTRNKTGYERIDIVQEKQRATKLVHRLVAAAFLMPPTSIDMQIHHKDFNNTNNKADNLQWLTPKQHKDIHNKHRKE